MTTDQTISRGLGFMSLGLGLAQLLAPRTFAESIGVRGRDEDTSLVRLVGVRELVAGAGLLTSRNPAPWLWLRVGGDLMDLALLGRAATQRRTDTERLASAIAGTVVVTAADVLSSLGAAAADGNGRDHALDGDRSTGGPFAAKPVRSAVTIAKSPAELYTFWRDLENLPTFMRHLEDVEELENGQSHWVATAPLGMRVEWDAEITEDVPDTRIAWRALPDSDVRHEGSVAFVPAPGDRGTEVRVELFYQPPAGPIGVAIAKLFGEEPEQQVAEDLRRFKQVMETGRVVVSEATGGERRLRQRPAQPMGAAG